MPFLRICEIVLFFLITVAGCLGLLHASRKHFLICIISQEKKNKKKKRKKLNCSLLAVLSKLPFHHQQPLAGKASRPLAAIHSSCSLTQVQSEFTVGLKMAIARVNHLPVTSRRLIVFSQVISVLLL